jgi:predicted ATP-grasp superfamily ATP-dependent carboligase
MPAIVLNMYYTGLGIARSLGVRGVRVIGLSAVRRHYGNATRYAEVRISPDSRKEPAALFECLMDFGRKNGTRAIIFPTRDDDIVFLDRYREKLGEYFVPAIPPRDQIGICLDKWETHRAAERAGIPAPKAWLVESRDEFAQVVPMITYPSVMKPVASYDWHRGGNWKLVGGRKAVGITSRQHLIDEYSAISAADERVLIEEMVPGDDGQLLIAACFCDAQSRVASGFTARKLVQIPAAFGTGCVVETVDRPDIMAMAERLLDSMGFHGIAEVEFKHDVATGEYKLIEINARPWDQHRLGTAAGTDVIWAAYLDYAGLPGARLVAGPAKVKWIAEDAFVMALLRGASGSEPSVSSLVKAAHGRRIFGVWSARDPLPSLVWLVGFAARLARTGYGFLYTRLRLGLERLFGRKGPTQRRKGHGFEHTET